jgi:hypothetical protein
MVAVADDLQAWFAARLPGWFDAVELRADREEILVVGVLADPDPGGGDHATRLGCIERFRAETRDLRMQVAGDAELVWGRKVSWGVRCGEVQRLFTTASVPVMTRLRMEERAVLDTLIDAGVARTRSEALAWCVRLVGANEAAWIERLREALTAVAEARETGPDPG